MQLCRSEIVCVFPRLLIITVHIHVSRMHGVLLDLFGTTMRSIMSGWTVMTMFHFVSALQKMHRINSRIQSSIFIKFGFA